MSWSPDVFIGELRPWPDTVHVVRGKTDETRRYMPESESDQLRAENDRLREDLEFERSENGWAREFLNRMGQKCGTKDCPSLVAYVTKLEAENAKLRELCEWLLTPYRLGAVTGEGVDKQWCRETYDGGSYRLRELGEDA